MAIWLSKGVFHRRIRSWKFKVSALALQVYSRLYRLYIDYIFESASKGSTLRSRYIDKFE